MSSACPLAFRIQIGAGRDVEQEQRPLEPGQNQSEFQLGHLPAACSWSSHSPFPSSPHFPICKMAEMGLGTEEALTTDFLELPASSSSSGSQHSTRNGQVTPVSNSPRLSATSRRMYPTLRDWWVLPGPAPADISNLLFPLTHHIPVPGLPSCPSDSQHSSLPQALCTCCSSCLKCAFHSHPVNSSS